MADGKLVAAGKPFAFTGMNFTDFMLGMSIRRDLNRESVAAAVARIKEWKVRMVRIPLNLGLIQPAEGVFPGNPRWEEIYKRHKLKTDFFRNLEYFISLAGDHGIYSVLEIHGVPKDPYRYFLGGTPADRAASKPGKAIAWLYSEGDKPTTFIDMRNPRECRALEETFRFLARHFRGDSNILGFEVPYNEPHDAYMSIPANYNRITGRIIRLIQAEDPDRLTFSMPPAWGHDNATWPATFLPPEGLSGGGPHFYVGNGPVPLRADSKQSREPWLCRDVELTFDYALPAVLFPYSGIGYPVFNGEGGEHGHRSFLPRLTPEEAASLMIEANLVQCYAAGLCGAVQWTMWSEKVFRQFEKVYAEQYSRFGDIYAAGPVDWSRAEAAIIQNPAAVPINNGYNFSCIPFVRLMLDLHLGGRLRYLTDDQIIHSGLTNVSAGLEQVSDAAMDSCYKALIVDRRNLDSRVEQALKKIKTPVLWVDDASRLTAEEFAAFLRENAIPVDTKSPADIQIVEGPEHLILYRRRGESSAATVYPLLQRKGIFSLAGEDGATVFTGDAEKLHNVGFKADVPKWRSRIYRIAATDPE
ncbi:cellulase family glycosylhydrolase [uncultured Victivallis sp.]|uniref:cellulase family glycosylhydrolase n=1 Tax=uncultured Victivallis sp. TaxID=354118 RepID=UPI00258F5A4A|nr:cellulase family glycosylhydrolase [uncultured Victivallis sp.]